jgi:hypothetical protein
MKTNCTIGRSYYLDLIRPSFNNASKCLNSVRPPSPPTSPVIENLRKLDCPQLEEEASSFLEKLRQGLHV